MVANTVSTIAEPVVGETAAAGIGAAAGIYAQDYVGAATQGVKFIGGLVDEDAISNLADVVGGGAGIFNGFTDFGKATDIKSAGKAVLGGLAGAGKVIQGIGKALGFGGDDNEIVLKADQQAFGEFLTGQRPVPMNNDQINYVKSKMTSGQINEWANNLVKNGKDPAQVSAFLGVNVAPAAAAPAAPPAAAPAAAPAAPAPTPAPPTDPLVDHWMAQGYSPEMAEAAANAQRAEQAEINNLIAQGHTPENAAVILAAQRADIAAQQASFSSMGY